MSTKMNPPIERATHQLDATGVPLGRLATHIADLLRGKQKTGFVMHLDVGDAVVVRNPQAVKLTGKKLYQKEYHHHTGWLGHLKTKTLHDRMRREPEGVIRTAVAGMLPHNRLHAQWLKRLAFQTRQSETTGEAATK